MTAKKIVKHPLTIAAAASHTGYAEGDTLCLSRSRRNIFTKTLAWLRIIPKYKVTMHTISKVNSNNFEVEQASNRKSK